MSICIYIVTNNSIYLTEDIYKTLSVADYQSGAFYHSADADIVGITTEQHYLARYNYPLTEDYIADTMKSYDMILPYAKRVASDCVREQLAPSLTESLSSILTGYGDNYVQALNRVLAGRLISPANQFIASRNLFIQAMDFTNNVMSKLGSCGDSGLITDIIFRVWIIAHEPSLRIKEEDSIVKNPDVFKNFLDKTDLVYRYVQILVQDLINARRADNFASTIITEKECDDDFDGKIPVWICWWQGIDDLPEIVRACIASIKRNLPASKTSLRIITLENCGRYVTFTDDIVSKFNEGKISFTHLADTLRVELLYRYGGLWIDATYFVSKPIPESFFDQDFYTVAFDKPLFGPDISGAHWSTSLWYVKPASKLMQFVTEEMWLYWEKEQLEEIIDYFVMDYEFAIPYREFPEIRAMIDACPKSSPAVYDLQLRLNQRCCQRELDMFVNDSTFYKINRRYEYVKVNELGQQTLYGYLCQLADTADAVSFAATSATSNDSSEPLYDTTMASPHILQVDASKGLTAENLATIRALNPDRILDQDMVLARCGYTSRSIIDNMLFGKIEIDGILPSGNSCDTDSLPDVSLPIDSSLYEHIYNDSENIDVESYTLTITFHQT